MYVTVVPNRGSPPAILLRETYREDGKVKNRTLANLSKWKPGKIAALRAVLRDERLLPAGDGFEIERALPHGHVAAALGMARRLGLDPRVKTAELMPAGAARLRLLALALIVARVIDPAAKLATARQLDAATASHSLGTVLGLGTVGVNELYAALDWLLAQQPKIEAKLARRHLGEGTLVLYAAAARWRSSAIAATAKRTKCRSSLACCAAVTAARSRSRYLPATPPTRAPSSGKSTSCGGASACAAWCWSAIAG